MPLARGALAHLALALALTALAPPAAARAVHALDRPLPANRWASPPRVAVLRLAVPFLPWAIEEALEAAEAALARGP